MAKDTDKIIDDEITRGDDASITDDDATTEEYQPSYRKMAGSKIPVSKSHGMLWKSRKDLALRRRKNDDWEAAWNESIRYYRNDQTAHRVEDDDPDNSANDAAARKMTRSFSETENIVFSNTSALVPSLYAKNPTIEVTAIDDADEGMAALAETLVTVLLQKKYTPGINLKPKVRRSVIMTTLTNSAYIEVGYTFRENSSNQAIQDLQEISEQLASAKDTREIEALEGKLQALEQSASLLRPPGPWARFRRPHDVLFDVDSVDEDREDAKWCMIKDYVSTSWLNAMYTEPAGEDGQRKSIYEPTHVLGAEHVAAGHNSAEAEIATYTLLDEDDDKTEYRRYGYEDEDTFNSATRTKVWYVWDKITRRVYMFADNNWKWPIWVWDDPYQLPGFFPVYKLQFYTDPEEADMRGEVSYYLDQQDGINTINSEMKQARQWARRGIFYDKNRVSKDEVEKLLKGDEDTAVGIDIPDGATLKDLVMPMLPPSLHVMELFDKQPLFDAVDRVSSVQPVMRGIEFKTNTTNEAINKYNSVQQTRIDEKIDAVEEFIGRIGYAILFMCLQFMSREEVAALIGDKRAVQWQNIDAGQITNTLQFSIIGGSTTNPTSEAKKQQAMNTGQILGQFVNAAPQPVLLAMLTIMRSAFNDVVPDETWTDIMDTVQQGTASPMSGGEAGAPSGDGGQDTSSDGAAQQANEVIAQLDELIQQLPPEAQQALGDAVSQGVPVGAALQRILPALQQQGTA